MSSLENRLQGFNPTEQFLNPDDRVEYLGVITHRGNHALIQLDVDGDITVNAPRHYLESSLSIPDEFKSLCYDCLNLNTNGVGFKCGDKYCLLIRNVDNLKSIEKVYTSGLAEGIIPIVRMSDVLHHPDAVIDSIHQLTLELQHLKFAQLSVQVNDSLNRFEEFRQLFDLFTCKSNSVGTNLLQTLSQCQEIYKLHNCPDTEQFKLLSYNLQVRNEKLWHYLDLLKKVDDLLAPIDPVSLREVVDDLTKNYSNVLDIYKR